MKIKIYTNTSKPYLYLKNENVEKELKIEKGNLIGLENRSTIIAKGLNKVKPLLDEIKNFKEQEGKEAMEIFGYAISHGENPSFKYGVGIEPIRMALSVLGYDLKEVRDGIFEIDKQ